MKDITRILFLLMSLPLCLFAQDIPQSMSYTRIYDFMDELANQGVIEVNSAIRPYSREFIAKKLTEAKEKDSLLNNRMRGDLEFFLQDYAIERDTLPNNTRIHKSAKDGKTWDVSLWQPAFQYNNGTFKFRVTPLLGGNVKVNTNGPVMQRWWGADIQATLWNHISLFANLRDQAYYGKFLKNGLQNADARLSTGPYLNLLPGVEYKEAEYGGDYSDMRGGIKFYCKYGSIGVVKDNVTWGESQHSSNILSGRGPSFPMLTLSFKPVRWIELNYIHGWLVSNVYDKSRYYMEVNAAGDTTAQYRPHNKYIAANMLTITPIKKLNISIGNSIIYGESAPMLAYFIPFAYYKALDHLQTKGLNAQNQNSQIFATISTRNIKNLHLYASIYIDEFKFDRIKSSNDEANPISYQVGASYSEPHTNLYANFEFTRSNIICYKHSIDALTFASNSYCLGHYLGDNSQEIYFKLGYRPIRKLDLSLSYTNARHFNDYVYQRKTVSTVISQKPFDELVWQNNSIAFKALYELINNCYVYIGAEYNHAQGYDRSAKASLNTYENNLTAQQYLDMYTPKFYQGKNFTFEFGFNFGF